MANKYFLPYQIDWLKDRSAIKVWEKARRIGATYTQSFEDVEDCVEKRVPDVWFSSADETAAKEYIDYCGMWAKIFNIVAKPLGQVILDEDKHIKALAIDIGSRRIHGLTSNPKKFRSKGGKVVLDEFAHHDDPRKMWAAAKPSAMWGDPVRILSTHFGRGLFWQFVHRIESGKQKKSKWSLHTTDLFQAVKDGLANKILSKTLGRNPTDSEIADWIEEQREDCGDEEIWQQEYCCNAVDEATAFLTYELIVKCELADIYKSLAEIEGDIYVGMDIGRKKHLSVIWLLEKLGHVKYSRQVMVLEKAPFKSQREALFEILKHPKMRRACIDATGLGMQLAEEALEAFGRYRVEAVTFNNSVKEDLAYGLLPAFEDRTLYIPAEPEIREDLHSMKKIVTASNNIRFDAAYSDKLGHGDRFWACALANHAAADKSSGPACTASRKRRDAADLTKGF
jgi:phage FluMu gp28-like protein